MLGAPHPLGAPHLPSSGRCGIPQVSSASNSRTVAALAAAASPPALAQSNLISRDRHDSQFRQADDRDGGSSRSCCTLVASAEPILYPDRLLEVRRFSASNAPVRPAAGRPQPAVNARHLMEVENLRLWQVDHRRYTEPRHSDRQKTIFGRNRCTSPGAP